MKLRLDIRWLVLSAVAMMLVAPVAGQSEETAGAPSPDQEESYRLVHKDKLLFRIEEDPVTPDQSHPVHVTSLGFASFPVTHASDLSIQLEVAGKTLEEVRSELKQRLNEKYYRDVTIHLTLQDQSPRYGQAMFSGAVKGVVELPPGQQVTVSEGIMQLAFDEFANLKKVELKRTDPKSSEIHTIMVNVKRVLEDGDHSEDEVLRDGDVVNVPYRRFLPF